MLVVRSLGCSPWRLTLDSVLCCLAFPSIPCLATSILQTHTMEQTGHRHTECSTWTVWGWRKTIIILFILWYCSNNIIIVPTGGVDPWHSLSVVQDRTQDREKAHTVFIKDTAHCADMLTPRATDRSSLREARQVQYVHPHMTLKSVVISDFELWDGHNHFRILTQAFVTRKWGCKILFYFITLFIQHIILTLHWICI